MDKALKQRLVGASVLVALAVIVLPMLLGGRSDGVSEVRKIELPPQPSEFDFETRRYPIGEARESDSSAPAARSAEALPAPRSQTVPSPSTPTSTEPDTGSRVEPSGAASSAPAEPATAAEAAGRYIVQVASFGAIENANRLSAALQEHGYDVLMDTVKSDVGTLHRVRVGPYAGEVQARNAAARLPTEVGDVRPRVMDLRPELGARVTTPADPMVRWVVQVGSFSKPANAENLVALLRLESLNAYHEEVSSSGASVHRVRVGPFLEREEAIRVEEQLQESMSLDGVVMAAD